MERNKAIDIPRTLIVLALAALAAHYFLKSDIWLALCAAILVFGSFDNKVGRSIATAWHAFGMLLGRINSRIILFVLFYAVLTPLAIMFRLMNRQAVDRFFGNSAEGYNTECADRYDKTFFERPW